MSSQLCRLTDSLDCLLESLNQAPVCGEQVPVLLYLAESVLYWVTANSAQKPQLYSCEVKMLKVGYLVFLRLFLSYISGNLKGYQKSKYNLHNFLKVLAQYDSCYQPHPDILFNVHFMLCTGGILCGTRPFNSDSVLSHADLQGYEMNQVLWHCLLSWYCVQNNIRQLPQVLHHLVPLRDDLLQHSWLDCGLGLMVLGEAAKSSLLCLHVLLDLPVNHRQDLSDPGRYSTSETLEASVIPHREDWRVRYSAVQALVNVCEGLRGDWSREGLRNVAWLALQEHLAKETDSRVTEASRVSEVLY
ncbi:hypothetical protein AAFF_G00185420 [Aldrovandia affinis]|uniref:Uncharacterized protein n=1 Tax=Aldrovandia affinis TaxID=143900 RepID=A0AAD7RMG1_9TELE|nr:hypothetical protein AAFF_G00185420 [Aldrovandia affinis]